MPPLCMAVFEWPLMHGYTYAKLRKLQIRMMKSDEFSCEMSEIEKTHVKIS